MCSSDLEEGLLLINSQGVIIRIQVAQISSVGRNAQGVRLINLADGVEVVCIAKVAADMLEEQEETTNE